MWHNYLNVHNMNNHVFKTKNICFKNKIYRNCLLQSKVLNCILKSCNEQTMSGSQYQIYSIYRFLPVLLSFQPVSWSFQTCLFSFQLDLNNFSPGILSFHPFWWSLHQFYEIANLFNKVFNLSFVISHLFKKSF